MIALSVIIPFGGRQQALQATLDSLAAQSLPASQFELVIVCDGEALAVPDTAHLPFKAVILRQANAGPGAARNHGVRKSAGELLLFLDGDIVASRDLLSIHVAQQQRAPALLNGAVEPWRAIEPSYYDKLVDWPLGEGRRQYGHGDRFSIPFYDSITQNLSLPRQLYDEIGGFDEQFRGYEDVEFAYRSVQAGYEVALLPNAVGYHNHSRTLDGRLKRAHFYATYEAALRDKHPQLADDVPAWVTKAPLQPADGAHLLRQKLTQRFWAWPPVYSGLKLVGFSAEKRNSLHKIAKPVYWRLMQAANYQGYLEGVRDREIEG